MCGLNTNVSPKILSRSRWGVKFGVGGRNVLAKIEFWLEPFYVRFDSYHSENE